MLEQRGNGAREADAAIVEEGDAAREAANLVEALRRPHDCRATVRAVLDQRADPAGSLGIEVMRRLVHEEDGGIGDERTGDREALLHPVGVLPDGALGCVGETDMAEQLGRALEGGAAAKAVQSAEEGEVLEPGDAEVERAVAARDEADEPARLAVAPLDLLAEHAHGARARAHEAGEEPQERRLPGAVRAEERLDLAWANREGDAVEREFPGEAADQVVRLDHRRHGRSRSGNGNRARSGRR